MYSSKFQNKLFIQKKKMRLSFEKRQRFVEIYHKKKLHFKAKKFGKLKLLDGREGIELSENGLRQLILKF